MGSRDLHWRCGSLRVACIVRAKTASNQLNGDRLSGYSPPLDGVTVKFYQRRTLSNFRITWNWWFHRNNSVKRPQWQQPNGGHAPPAETQMAAPSSLPCPLPPRRVALIGKILHYRRVHHATNRFNRRPIMAEDRNELDDPQHSRQIDNVKTYYRPFFDIIHASRDPF